MLFFLFRIGSWYLWAAFSAALEVNIEGPRGWASGLPTPRRTTGGILRRLVQMTVMGGRPVTGYHACMLTLQFMAFNVMPYAFGLPFTRMNACLGLSAFFLSCATWDFLWFVFNPAYGTKKFKKEHVGWHAHRWWPYGLFPVDYAIAALASVAFAVLALWPFDLMSAIAMVFGYYLWAMLVVLTVDPIGPWVRARRVRLLAGNVPPILEENVDDERHEDVEEDMIEEEEPDEELPEEDPPAAASSGNG